MDFVTREVVEHRGRRWGIHNSGCFLVVVRARLRPIRYAAAVPVLAGGRNNAVPEEHQKSWCCLHVNKAVNTQFNAQLHHNHDAREHCF